MDETTPLADWLALDRRMKEILSRPASLPPQALSAEQAAVLAATDDAFANREKASWDRLDKMRTELED